MKSEDLYSKKRLVMSVAIILIAVFASIGAFRYKSYLDNRWSNFEIESEIEETEIGAEEPWVGEGSISILEEEIASKAIETEDDIKEVLLEDDLEAEIIVKENDTREKTAQAEDVSSVPAIKMETPSMDTMLTPVFGSVCLDFSDGELLYSKTLDLWTIHDGIDIKAEEGSQVRAAMDGCVSEIRNDPQWGLTIVLDHGDGITTKYSNLSTLDMVTLGQKIKKGDVISGIGRTAICEIAEDPHLHFEVIKNGENLDPKIYLPKKSLNR